MTTPSLHPNGRRALQPTFDTNKRRDSHLLPLRRGSGQHEFFTDSLEYSQIPSPSPAKAATNYVKPRRSLRSVRPSSEGTNNEKGNRSESSSSSDTKHPDENIKPSPLSSQRRSKIPTRSATPSPARGRPLHLSLQSPQSDASSPPRGLKESYQRIDEEENLTAQEGEGELGEEAGYEEDQSAPDDTFEQASIDRLRLRRIRSSISPKSRSPSLIPRRSSSRLDQMITADNKENIKDDDTARSTTSGLSFLDEVTNDTIGKKIHEHAVDKQRLERMKRRESPAFGGVSSRTPRLTAENLQRRSNGYDDSPERNVTPTGSVSERSDIPLNVPKSWGSNGKVTKDWLNRPNNRRNISPHPSIESPTSGMDWQAAASKIPIPSIENSSSPPQLYSQMSTPTNGFKNPSIDKVREWEVDADFTARSLQVSSSPPIRPRGNALNEIEALERKGVTTSRLGEIHKRASDELLRKRSPTPSLKESCSLEILENNRGATPSIDEQPSPIQEEREAVSNTPVVIHAASPPEDVNESHQSSDASNTTVKGKEKEPEYDLHDSQELLRRLARATSVSPGPVAENWTLVDEEGNSQNPDSGKEDKPVETAEEAPAPAPATDTPAPVKQEIQSKTPIVTGAWLDTPLPTDRRSGQEVEIPGDLTNGIEETVSRPKPRRPSETKPKESREVVLQRPNLPKSALEAVIDGVKKGKAKGRRNDSLMITEDTIDSLESLLGLSDEEMSTLLKFPNLHIDPSLTFDKLDIGATSGREHDHIAQMAVYGRLTNRLQLLRHSIHDAKNGISKLEQQVATTDSLDQAILHCPDCACPWTSSMIFYPRTISGANADYIPLYLPTPRLWRRQKNRILPKPTLLGWALLVVFSWSCVEWYLAYWYSPRFDWNPIPAPHFPIKWDAPVYPWVTATKLYEWGGLKGFSKKSKSTWDVLRMIVTAIARLVAQITGWGDGFVGDDPPGHVPVSMDSRIPKPNYGPDLSMMEDEYL